MQFCSFEIKKKIGYNYTIIFVVINTILNLALESDNFESKIYRTILITNFKQF